MIPVGFLGSQTYPPAEASQVSQTHTDSNSSVYTWTISLGAEDPNRVIVVMHGQQVLISSVTINGVSATLVGSAYNQISYVHLPTGTTGTMVITLSAGDSRSGYYAFRVIPGKSKVPYVSINDTSLSFTSSTMALKKDSVMFVLASRNTGDSNNGLTWNGAETMLVNHHDFQSSGYCWTFGRVLTPILADETVQFTCTLKQTKFNAISFR